MANVTIRKTVQEDDYDYDYDSTTYNLTIEYDTANLSDNDGTDFSTEINTIINGLSATGGDDFANTMNEVIAVLADYGANEHTIKIGRGTYQVKNTIALYSDNTTITAEDPDYKPTLQAHEDLNDDSTPKNNIENPLLVVGYKSVLQGAHSGNLVIDTDDPAGHNEAGDFKIKVESLKGRSGVSGSEINKSVGAGSYIYLSKSNDGYLGEDADYWTKSTHYRSQLIEVGSASGNSITLKDSLNFSIDETFDFAEGVTFENATDEQFKDSASSDMIVRHWKVVKNSGIEEINFSGVNGTPDSMSNTAKKPNWINHHMVQFNGVIDGHIKDVEIKDSMSSAMSVNRSVGLNVDGLKIDGSYNKDVGEDIGGNGYGVLLYETWGGNYDNLEIKNMRHSVLFNGYREAKDNDIHVKFTDRDINFHGGKDVNNDVEVDVLDYRNPTTGSQGQAVFYNRGKDSVVGSDQKHKDYGTPTNQADNKVEFKAARGSEGYNDLILVHSDLYSTGYSYDSLPAHFGSIRFDGVESAGAGQINKETGLYGDTLVLQRKFSEFNDVTLSDDNSIVTFKVDETRSFEVTNFDMFHFEGPLYVEPSSSTDASQGHDGQDYKILNSTAFFAVLASADDLPEDDDTNENPDDTPDDNTGDGEDLPDLPDQDPNQPTWHYGTDAADEIDASAIQVDGGSVWISSGDGNDTVRGSDNDDHLVDYGTGDDELRGNRGDDRIDVLNSYKADVFGGSGDDDITFETEIGGKAHGGAGNDTIGAFHSSGHLVVDGYDGTDLLILSRYDISNADVSGTSSNISVTFSDNYSMFIKDVETIRLVSDNSGQNEFSAAEFLAWAQPSDDPTPMPPPDETDPHVKGTNGNDTTIHGDDQDNFVELYVGNDSSWGFEGDDVMYAHGGNDTLYGGLGRDTLVGGSGDDRLYGGQGSDSLEGEAGNDSLDGGIGDDTLVSVSGSDTLIGGTGSDWVLVQDDAANSLIDGGNGNDSVHVDVSGSVSVSAGSDEDKISLFNFGGNSVVDGEDGYDHIYLNFDFWKNDVHILGSGVSIDLSPTASVTITNVESYEFADADSEARVILEHDEFVAWSNSDDVDVDPNILVGTDDADVLSATSNHTRVVGQDGDDTITGDANSLEIFGGFGNDQITGSSSDDTIEGGLGDDTVDGGDGDDSIDTGDGHDSISANLGSDTIVSGHGNDTIEASFYSGALDIDVGEGNDSVEASRGNDTIQGFGGADTLIGWDGDDSIDGGRDNDEIFGGRGSDTLYGDHGDDHLSSGTGSRDSLNGGAGNDTISAMSSDTTIDGGDGDDVIRFNGNHNEIDGGDGNDVIYVEGELSHGSGGYTYVPYFSPFGTVVDGGFGRDKIFDGDGSSTLRGGAGTDRIMGFGGDDSIFGGLASDSLYGGEGNDSIGGGNWHDSIFGGAGNDSLDGGSHNDTVLGQNGDDTVIGGDGADDLTGNDGDDVLYGDAGNDSIDGGRDNDFIDGGSQGDTLIGGTGVDTLLGGLGNDSISGGSEGDQISGNEGNDTINGDGGNDDVEGGDGLDSISGGDGDDSLSGGAQKDTITGDVGDDVIDGGDSPDDLKGGYGNDTIFGGQGKDTIFGGADDDYAEGGDQSDVIDGSNGHDELFGGSGDDTIIGGKGNDTINGGVDDDWLSGGTEADIVNGENGHDTIFGGSFDDSLDGGAGNDFIRGDNGLDVIYVGSGTDFADGGKGDDKIYSGSGNATIIGGLGNDTMVASAGSDTFIFGADTGSDRIKQFSADHDTIELDSSLVYSVGVAGNHLMIDLGNGDSIEVFEAAHLYQNDAGQYDFIETAANALDSAETEYLANFGLPLS